MYEWYFKFGLFILLITLLVIIIVSFLNRNTNKYTKGRYQNLNMLEKLTPKFLRGELDMAQVFKNIKGNPVVNNSLRNSLLNYLQAKQLESSLGATELSRCAAIIEAHLIEEQAFEERCTVTCMKLLKNHAEAFSDQERTLLSAKLIESPLVFLEEMQNIVESKGEENLLVSDAISNIVENISKLNVSPPKITDESSDDNSSSDDSIVKTNQNDTTDSSNENHEKVQLTEEQKAIEINRESEDVIAEANFRHLLPQFGNGIDSAIASCYVTTEDSHSTCLKSTSDWNISDLASNELNKLLVAFRQHKNDTTQPYLEVYNYLEGVIKSRSQTEHV